MRAERPLAGRSAIVTGSGRNIGRAMAKALARAGARLVINGHSDKTALDSVVREIEVEGGEAISFVADVGDPEAIAAMVDEARRVFGRIDIAISNAAIRPRQGFLDISVEDWRSVLNTNLNAAFYMARAVLPHMMQQGVGSIVHISGADGFHARSTMRAHNIVSKAGVHALTRVLANEFGPHGIRVNTLAPGPTATERSWPASGRGAMHQIDHDIPLGRPASVEEIAKACLFLVSDAGSFVTGQVLHVNGGESTFSS